MTKETDEPTIEEVLNPAFTEDVIIKTKKRIRRKPESEKQKPGRKKGVSKGFIPMSVYFPPDLKADLQAEANQEKRTLNAHIIHILTQYLKRRKKTRNGGQDE